jgi:hypothetical protein
MLLTKVTHGVCDPKELRATTSCGHILCLSSGLRNTRLFLGRPRHQRGTQKLASPRIELPIQPTLSKIRVRKSMKSQRRRRKVPKVEVSEGPIRRLERGEWMGADKNSSWSLNSAYSPNSQPMIPTWVCQGQVVTMDLPTLGTNPNSKQYGSAT